METAGDYELPDTAEVESSLEVQGKDYTDIDGENPKLRIPIAPPARKGCKFSKRTRMHRLQEAALKQPGPRREIGSPVEKMVGKKSRNGGGSGGGGTQPMNAGLKRKLSSALSDGGKKKRSAAEMAASGHPKKGNTNGANKKAKT